MTEQEIEEQEYVECLQKLEDAVNAEAWLQSPEWEPFRRAWKKTYELGLEKLKNTSPHKDPLAMVELQVFCHFYEDISKTVEMYRKLGEEAYSTAKERNWLDKVATFLKMSF